MTSNELDWLNDKIKLSNGYERKMKNDIRRKLRIFNEFELPLLVKSAFIAATANCNIATTDCNTNIEINSSKIEICAQSMGPEGMNLEIQMGLI